MVCARFCDGCFVLILVDCDLDLDLHAIWQKSSGIPTPPPCLATNLADPRHILSNEGEHAGYGSHGSSLIERFFHPNHDNLWASSGGV